VEAGAAAVIAAQDLGLAAPTIVADPRRAYALAAAAYSAQPAKWSQSDRHQRQDLGRQFLPPDVRRGLKAGSMGTLGVRRKARPDGYGAGHAARLTTPDAADVAE
jgi:hypothetical protein